MLRVKRNHNLINKKYLLNVAIILLFFPPDGVYFLGMNWLLSLYRYVTCLVVFLLLFKDAYVLSSEKKMTIKLSKENGIYLLLALFSFSLLISTVINHGSRRNWLDAVLCIGGSFLICRRLIRYEEKSYVSIMKTAFSILIVVNFIGIIVLSRMGGLRILSSGISDFWLFGQKNAMRNIVFPAMAFFLHQDMILNKKISFITIFFSVVGLGSIFYVKSGTSIVIGFLLFVLFVYIGCFEKGYVRFSWFLVGFLVICSLLVFLRKIAVFSYFIEVIMRKDITLTGRVGIWDNALEGIKQRIFLGKGMQSLINSGLYTQSGFSVSHAHNAVLDILYKAGAIGTSIYFMIVAISCKYIISYKNCMSSIWGTVLGCFLLAGTVGELWNSGFFIVLFSSFYLVGGHNRKTLD